MPISYHDPGLYGARTPAPPPSRHPTLSSSLQASCFPVVRGQSSRIGIHPSFSSAFTNSMQALSRMPSPGDGFSIASTGTASRVPQPRPSGGSAAAKGKPRQRDSLLVTTGISSYAAPNIAILRPPQSFFTRCSSPTAHRAASCCLCSSSRLSSGLRETVEQSFLFSYDKPRTRHVGTAARHRIRSRRSANSTSEAATSAHWKVVLLE